MKNVFAPGLWHSLHWKARTTAALRTCLCHDDLSSCFYSDMNFTKIAGNPHLPVILSAAKNLRSWHTYRSAHRSFAALRMTGLGGFPIFFKNHRIFFPIVSEMAR